MTFIFFQYDHQSFYEGSAELRKATQQTKSRSTGHFDLQMKYEIRRQISGKRHAKKGTSKVKWDHDQQSFARGIDHTLPAGRQNKGSSITSKILVAFMLIFIAFKSLESGVGAARSQATQSGAKAR